MMLFLLIDFIFLKYILRGIDGFVGCLGDLYIGFKKYNLQAFTRNEIIKGCQIPCFQAPCQNFGVCKGNYSSFSCDCSATQYIGQVCNHSKYYIQ